MDTFLSAPLLSLSCFLWTLFPVWHGGAWKLRTGVREDHLTRVCCLLSKSKMGLKKYWSLCTHICLYACVYTQTHTDKYLKRRGRNTTYIITALEDLLNCALLHTGLQSSLWLVCRTIFNPRAEVFLKLSHADSCAWELGCSPKESSRARPLACTFPHRCASSKGVQRFLVKQIRRKRRSCTWFCCVLSWSNINLFPVANSSWRCSPKVPARFQQSELLALPQDRLQWHTLNNVGVYCLFSQYHCSSCLHD